jgi:flagellar basal-body rod modification protein FlgD
MQIDAIKSASASDAATASTQNPNSVVSKDAFLQLLVAQIKNQDPLNPTDGVQFLSQLAQFSQLEQLMGIKDELTTLVGNQTGATSTTGIQPAGVGGNK